MSTFDDLARELGIDLSDPEVQLARDLSDADDELLETLVKIRKARGMTQQDVANALGRHKSSVSNFERLGADPHLSTIRRYAAAVGARITHTVEAVDGLEHTCGGTTFEQHVRDSMGSRRRSLVITFEAGGDTAYPSQNATVYGFTKHLTIQGGRDAVDA